MEKDSKVLSIIIPVYNVEKYIAYCIDSIVNQYKGGEDLEVILVDDGSPDNSVDIINKYLQEYPYLRLIRQKNSGLSIARNSGIEVASGRYLWFIDSDDWVMPDILEKVLNILRHDDETDVYVTAMRNTVVEENKSRDDFLVKKDIKLTGREYLRSKFPKTAAVRFIVKRRLLCDNGLTFYPHILHEDVLYCYTMLYYAQKVTIMKNTAYGRRLGRSNSIMNNIGYKNVENMLFVHQKICEFCDTSVTPSDRNWYYQLAFVPLVMTCNMIDKFYGTETYKRFWDSYRTVVNSQCESFLKYGGFKFKTKVLLVKYYPHFFVRLTNKNKKRKMPS